MAFSGAISQTVFDTRKVIDNAVRRCRIPAEQISSEYIDIANDQLYLLLSDLANQGLQLWCIEREIYPLYEGVGQIALTAGTVDVLNSNLRTLQQITGINTDSATEREVDFTDEAVVSTVGIKWSAAGVPLEFARSDDGSTWTVIQTEAAVGSSGDWSWYDLDSTVPARFFRIRATSGSLGFSRLHLGNTPTEIPLGRMNRDDYTALPNKAFMSQRPLQFWLDRQVRLPVMRLWPVPNEDAETSQIVVWRQRHIMDVGAMTQEVEVPQRWYEAIVSGLAAKLALELAEVDPQLVPMLDGKADRALFIAQQEERDNSPINILPNISAYTR